MSEQPLSAAFRRPYSKYAPPSLSMNFVVGLMEWEEMPVATFKEIRMFQLSTEIFDKWIGDLG